jgi:prepilin-type N-terminal cleavage/methylation domain-containing protein
MKIRTHIKVARKSGGFSLVELLIAIFIIGILAMLIVPTFVMQVESSDETKAKLNAQTVASLASQARIAGATEFDRANTVPEAIQALVNGVHGKGHLSNSEFKLNPMSPDEITMVSRHLTITGGALQLR